MKRSLALAVALALGACATTHTTQEGREAEPITYRAAPDALGRTVGNLRRLLVLPLQLDASPERDKCLEPCDPDALREAIQRQAERYLVDWKGYEVLAPGAGHAAQAAALREALKRGDAQGQASAAALVRELGRAAEVDGVVLVEGSARFLSKAETASWYYTFALSIPFSMARLGSRLEARIFSTATGELVWGSGLRVGGSPEAFHGDYGEGLFSPIERALPEVMIERRK